MMPRNTLCLSPGPAATRWVGSGLADLGWALQGSVLQAEHQLCWVTGHEVDDQLHVGLLWGPGGGGSS